MTTAQKWFAVAAVLGAVFLYQVHAITRLDEEAAVLKARIDEVNDPWSGSNIGSYCKSFFDGFTFGIFAEDGMFTEYNKMEKKIGNLRDAVASLTSRYSTATRYRNLSLLGALGCVVVAVVVGKKQKKDQTSQPPPAN